MGGVTYLFLTLIGFALIFVFTVERTLKLILKGSSTAQFELLRQIVKDAVSHVNQISLEQDMNSFRKKEVAIKVAEQLATSFCIDPSHIKNIPALIESLLWEEPQDLDLEDEEDDL